MADVTKLAKVKKNRLGNPPAADDVATSLNSPEVAPVSKESQDASEVAAPQSQPYVRIDGRTARATNRTLSFATRVSPEFDQEFREIAIREGLKLVELLELSLQAYKEKHCC